MLETVTIALEPAGEPMRAREINAAVERLAGEPLLSTSVGGVLVVYAEGSEARF
ncbi:MAG: hypothetical protein ABSC51_12070 [Gaiellaceae bacterium]